MTTYYLICLSWRNPKTGGIWSFTCGVPGIFIDALYPDFSPRALVIYIPKVESPYITFFRSLFTYLAFFVGLATFILVLMYLSLISTISNFLSSLTSSITLFFSSSAPVYSAPRANFKNTFHGSKRPFHSSALVPSGLSRHNVHSSVPMTTPTNKPYWLPGEPLPEAVQFFVELPSIYSSDFMEQLYSIINQICNSPGALFAILIDCRMKGNRYRTLAPTINCAPNTTLAELDSLLRERIENFEAQSGTGEEGSSVIDTRVRLTNISTAPEPNVHPFSASPANIQWKADIKTDRKASRRPSASVQSITNLQSSIDSQFDNLSSLMSSGFKEVVNAIKTQPTPSVASTALNWTPLIQGIVTGIASSYGAQVNFPTTSTPPTSTPGEVQVAQTPSLAPIEKKISDLASQVDQIKDSVKVVNEEVNTKITNLETKMTKAISQLTIAQTNTNSQINSLTQSVAELAKIMTLQLSSDSNGNSSSGDSTPPTSTNNSSTLAPSGAPQSYLHAKAEKEGKRVVEYSSCVMLANKLNLTSNEDEYFTEDDFEALILPNGKNYVYMAAWYSGPSNIMGLSQVYDLTQFSSQETFFKAFWQDLITRNEGLLAIFIILVGMTLFFPFL